MPGFFSVHAVGDQTAETLRECAEKLALATDDAPVKLVRSVCDVNAGRMLCEWVAQERDAVLAFLRAHEMEPSGEGEWIIRVDFEEPPASPPINPEPD